MDLDLAAATATATAPDHSAAYAARAKIPLSSAPIFVICAYLFLICGHLRHLPIVLTPSKAATCPLGASNGP